MSGKTEKDTDLFTPRLERSLSSSLHWYVNQSLTDLLEDFMFSDETKDSVERQALLTQMVELPIGFDETTRQLTATIIIETIQREITTSKGLCMELITGLIRRMDHKRLTDVSTLLLKDFEILVDMIFFKDSANNNEGDECRRAQRGKSEKSVSERLKEAIAYAKILIKLFRLGFLKNRIPILVVLNKLSQRKPNPFYANLLLYILREVGASLIEETKYNNGDRIRICWNPSRNLGGNDTPTIDNVLARVENFYKYVPSHGECISAVKKLVEERKKKVSEEKGKASKFDYVRYSNIQDVYDADANQISTKSSNCNDGKTGNGEAVTSF